MTAKTLAAPNPCLAQALEFADWGMRSFPIVAPIGAKKAPGTRGGFADATTDTATIKRWYRNPEFVGLSLVAGEQLIALDVDVKKGAMGPESMRRIVDRFGPPPATIKVVTPSGGYHLWFRLREGQSHKRMQVIPDGTGPKKREHSFRDVEVLSTGGGMMCPPSLHESGTRYTWGDGRAPRSLDDVAWADWLLGWLEVVESEADQFRKARTVPAKAYAADDDQAWVPDALAHLSSDCVREDWIRVGMALRSCPDGLALWDAWSAKAGDRYPGQTSIEGQWRSMQGGTGVGLGTLWTMAKEAGWRPPERATKRAMPNAPRWAVEPVEPTPDDATPSAIAREDSPPPPDDDDFPELAGAEPLDGSAIAALTADQFSGRQALIDALSTPRYLNELRALHLSDPSAYAAHLLWLGATHGPTSRAEVVRAVKAGMLPESPVDRALSGMRTGVLVVECVASAPCPRETVVPPGYELDDSGVYRITDGANGPARTVVASCPLVLCAVEEDVATGTQHYAVSWLARGRWHPARMRRADAAAARSVVAYAEIGLPVTSVSAVELVRYLAACEAANQSDQPVTITTTRLGWQRDGSWVSTCESSPGAPQVSTTAEVAASLARRGTLAGWKAIVSELHDVPIIRAMIAASAASPCLVPLASSGFVCDLWFPTSGGKTLANQVAASLWADPSATAEPRYMRTWDTTPAWLEAAFQVLSGHTGILDDSKRAGKAEVIERIVYALVDGQGKGRAKPDGTRPTAHYQTVLLSTSEGGLSHQLSGGGARARVVQLSGAPWGERSTVAALRAIGVVGRLGEHYGWAGPALGMYLHRHRETWPELAAHRRSVVAQIVEGRGEVVGAMRIAEHLATMGVAGELLAAAVGLPWRSWEEWVSPEVIASAMGAGVDADRAEVAWHHALGWLAAQSGRLWSLAASHMPAGGWVGVWGRGEDALALPEPLEAELRRAGFDASTAVATWVDRGWCRHDRVRLDGRRPRALRLVVDVGPGEYGRPE